MVTVAGDIAYFQFCRPSAQQVFLVGDFNRWQLGQLAMRREEDGRWRASLRLPPGTYHFRYVADGLWYVDFASFGIERGPHGHNSVLYIRGGPPACAAANAQALEPRRCPRKTA